MPLQRESHVGGLLIGILLIVLLLGAIAFEFYYLLNSNNLLSGSQDMGSGAQLEESSLGELHMDEANHVSFQFPRGWKLTNTIDGNREAGFIAHIDEASSTDSIPAYVSLWRIEHQDGLQSYANSMRNVLTERGEVVQEDQPLPNGIYVFSTYRQVVEEGFEPWASMHAVYIIPESLFEGGQTGAFIVLEMYDNVDTFNTSLNQLRDVIFPTLRKI